MMRGQWESQTRRLNRHYQSVDHGKTPWQYIDAPYVTMPDNWDNGRGVGPFWGSPYNLINSNTYKCGTYSIASSSGRTGTSLAQTRDTVDGWGYYLDKQNLWYWELGPAAWIGDHYGATTIENGPLTIQNKLMLIKKGRFSKNCKLRIRITVLPKIADGIEPVYYLRNFIIGRTYLFFAGNEDHYGSPDYNPDIHPVKSYFSSSLIQLANDNYTTSATGAEYFRNFDGTGRTYGHLISDIDESGRYYYERVIDTAPAWEAFADKSDYDEAYDKMAVGFLYSIETPGTTATMALRSMIQIQEEE